MDTVTLTKKLIQIPSYFKSKCNENAIGDYIFNYLSKNSRLIVKKQKVEGNRNNIIAYTSSCVSKGGAYDVDYLFVDHIDTVEPKEGWKINQFEGVERDNKVFGLGSFDTKGNVAVLLKLAEIVENEKIMFLFYVDEEYDFKGIKQFIKQFKESINTKNIISTDGSSMEIRTSCRGLIEIDLEVRGRSGHSANPNNGINSIAILLDLIQEINQKLKMKNQPELGLPTLNIAYINGGLLQSKRTGKATLSRQGNNIADFAECTLELRTNKKTPIEWLLNEINKFEKITKASFIVKKIRHNLSPWITNKSDVVFLEKSIKDNNIPVRYTNAGLTGYVDLALLSNEFKSNCCAIGASGKNGHAVNEYVEIDSLSDLFNILTTIIHR